MRGRTSTVASFMRTTALGACFLGILGSILFVAAVRERRLKSMIPNNVVMNAAIPPIDRSAPTGTETATFASG